MEKICTFVCEIQLCWHINMSVYLAMADYASSIHYHILVIVTDFSLLAKQSTPTLKQSSTCLSGIEYD